MRFILFNLAVGAALIYLFNGGQLPAMDWKAGLAQLKAEVTGKETVAAPKQIAAAGQSHGRDVIEPPKPEPKPDPKPQPAPKPSTGSTKTKVPPVPPAVAQRRAEVLGETVPETAALPAARRVQLEPGTAMMSAADRKRELDALAEEMEMLYIQKIGG
jgi:hypothetical protein